MHKFKIAYNGWGRDGDGGVTVGDGTVTVTVGDTKGLGSEESEELL
jgi:hypothetical protein